VRPQPPGAASLVLVTELGDTVKKLTFAHSMVSQELSTSPPVSPELAFQSLHAPKHGFCHVPMISFSFLIESLSHIHDWRCEVFVRQTCMLPDLVHAHQ
jgi:hypothetical protein